MPWSSVTGGGAPKEIAMDDKREQIERRADEDGQDDLYLPEPEVPDEVEAWALDDVVDILPSAFD